MDAKKILHTTAVNLYSSLSGLRGNQLPSDRFFAYLFFWKSSYDADRVTHADLP